MRRIKTSHNSIRRRKDDLPVATTSLAHRTTDSSTKHDRPRVVTVCCRKNECRIWHTVLKSHAYKIHVPHKGFRKLSVSKVNRKCAFRKVFPVYARSVAGC